MKRDFSKANLHIINGLNGNEIVKNEFFENSHYVQGEILSEIVLPLLYDYENVILKIGNKNN